MLFDLRAKAILPQTLPGSTATPRLLRVAIHDAMVPLFALAAAGHLASVQAALAASSVQQSLANLVTGNAQEEHYARSYRFQLMDLTTCDAEEWAEDLLTSNIAQYAVDIGTS